MRAYSIYARVVLQLHGCCACGWWGVATPVCAHASAPAPKSRVSKRLIFPSLDEILLSLNMIFTEICEFTPPTHTHAFFTAFDRGEML